MAKERIARGKFSKKIYVDAIEKLITANPKLSNDMVMKWRSLVLPARYNHAKEEFELEPVDEECKRLEYEKHQHLIFSIRGRGTLIRPSGPVLEKK